MRSRWIEGAKSSVSDDATATTSGIENSLKSIGSDLGKIKDAQPQLSADRKQQVQAANQAFRTELDSVVSNLGQNVSLANAETKVKTAVEQLAQAYKQTFAPINCTLYFSSTPPSESSMARFKAVCPPTVGSTAKPAPGDISRSMRMISSRYSSVSGSM